MKIGWRLALFFLATYEWAGILVSGSRKDHQVEGGAPKNTTLSLLKRGLPQLNEARSSIFSPEYLRDMYMSGLRRVTAHAKTEECARKIEGEYMRQMRVVSEESPYPFEDVYFHTQCPLIWDEAAAETQQPLLPVLVREPPRGPDTKHRFPLPPKTQPDWRTLSICYVVLIHDFPDFAIRLMRAINEPQHTFVIHVDAKATEETVGKLRIFAAEVESKNVWLLDDSQRQHINWGGFSMVNATLIAMHFAWDILYMQHGRHFDYVIDVSGTSYPIKSNEEIRKTLASGKPGAVYMDVQSDASRPLPEMWQMYVECDDRLHRIARMPLLRGMNLHIGSQWFALPRHVVDWFLHNKLPRDYISYAKYIVVADENYFSTLFKNSPYCQEQDSKNLLFVLFDKWENERTDGNSTIKRDVRKCLHPDPDHCGRSPTTLTTEYRRLLQVSRFMFARKFDPAQEESMRLVDDLDRWRSQAGRTAADRLKARQAAAASDEGNHFMLRYVPDREHIAEASRARAAAKVFECPAGSVCPSVENQGGDANGGNGKEVTGQQSDEASADVCVEMGKSGERSRLRECDSNKREQWFTIGPCTEGANVTFADGYCALPTPGYEDAFCMLQGWKGEQNLCLDISGENANGGSPLITYDCSGQWNQLFRFMSDCSLSAVQPEFIGKVRGAEGRNVTLCMEKAQPENPEDEEDSLDGAPINAEVCPENAAGGTTPGGRGMHRFHAISEEGPEQLKYRWRKPGKRRRGKWL